MFGRFVVFLFVSLLAEINGQDNCMDTPCSNGGVCGMDPSMACENCPAGFEGFYCQEDVDECATDTDNCVQICNNTVGGFTCLCMAGYYLGNDNHTCIDINECENGTDECDHGCSNTIGSYECSCQDGCRLDSNGQTCLDIDECTEMKHDCNQNCTNKNCNDGMYECSCSMNGYVLGSDDHTCIDVNECDDGVCEQQCINQIGSYYCDCLPGCTLDINGNNCSDTDECALDDTLCQHKCSNVECDLGQYYCSCFDGYVLSDDSITCEDENECDVNNGGCQHNCNNMEASYNCSCNTGYELDQDGLLCNALPCEYELENPLYGQVTCTGANVTGTECTYTCNEGFYLEGNMIRTCKSDSSWSGENPSCLKLACPELEPEDSSLILLPCAENTDESVCISTCEQGKYIGGNDLYQTQTCSLIGQNLFWTDAKLCLANFDVCDPNPCYNNGYCSTDSIGSAMCSCGDYHSGYYCEKSIIVTPDIPILMEDEESDPLYIFTESKRRIEITIIVDSSVEVLPDKKISFLPSDANISFILIPSVKGYFEINYLVSNVTEDSQIDLPETKYFVVGGEDTTRTIFDEYNITDYVLLPGCCQHIEDIHSSFCLGAGQEISLSSSCGWEDEYKTNGITFLHSGNISLPISIVGIDSISSRRESPAGPTCEKCEYDGSSMCINRAITTNDISEMIKQQSLIKTFLSNIQQILPSNVLLLSHGNNVDYESAENYSYYASFTNSESLSSYYGCENLQIDSDELLYVVRTNSKISGNVFGFEFETNDITETVCFAIDTCRLPQSSLYISIPNSVQDSVKSWLSASFSIPNNVITDVRSLYVSSNGVNPSSDVKNFWNGSAMIDIQTPYYDYGLDILATVVDQKISDVAPKFNLSFNGSFYGQFNTTIPLWVTGEYDARILLHFDVDEFLFLKSINQDGLFIQERMNDFKRGFSVSLRYNPDSSGSEIFSKFFETDNNEECLAHTYINWDYPFSTRYFSLRSVCFIMKTVNLTFPSLTTTITLPSTEGYWPSDPETAIRAVGWNLNESPIALGNYISIPTSSALYLDILSNGSFVASLNNAKFYFIDVTVDVDINFSPELSFTTTVEFYDKYQAWIEGWAEPNTSWNETVLSVMGRFLDNDNSFSTDVSSNVQQFLTFEGQLFRYRQHHLAETNFNNSKIQVDNFEREIQKVQNELDQLCLEIENLTEAYEYALSNITQYDNTFQFLANTLGISESDLDATNALCDAMECSQNDCQFESDAINCDTIYEYPWIESKEKINYFTISKQHNKVEEIWSCSESSVCNTYGGVGWFLENYYNWSNMSVIVDSDTAVPYAYTAKLCQNICQNEEITWSVKENLMEIENVTQVYLYTEDIMLNRTRVCFVQDDCQLKFLDEPCTTINYDCENSKKLKTIAVLPNTSNKLIIMDNYDEYNNEVLFAIATRNSLEMKQFNKGINEQNLLLLKAAYNSSVENYKIAQYAYNKTKEIDSLVNDLVTSYTSDQLFKIESISFSMLFASQSPQVVPLMINYTIPYTEQNFIFWFELNKLTPLNLAMDNIVRSLVDHLLQNIDTNYTSQDNLVKFGYDGFEELFESNCILLEEAYILTEHQYQSLMDVQSDFSYSKNVLEMDLKRINDRANDIISSTPDLNSFKNNLIETQTQYVNIVELYYSQMETTIEESLLIHWLEVTNAYTNSTNDNCFSFVDCLKISTDLIASIVSRNNEAIDMSLERLSLATINLLQLSEVVNLTAAEAIQLISPILSLLQDIRQLNYWCSTKPNITEHPIPEVYLNIDDTTTLKCVAESDISVFYRWWKDDVIIENEWSSELVISGFKMSHLGVYTCEAYNDVGSTYSLPSTVYLYVSPIITVHPMSLLTFPGTEGIQFQCEGESTYSFYWRWIYQKEGEDQVVISNSSNILFLDAINKINEGLYHCEMVTTFGSVSSDRALLTVAEASIATVRYPMFFVIQEEVQDDETGSTDVVSSKLHHEISSDAEFIKYLRGHLEWLGGQNTNNTSIEEISVMRINDFYTVSFELSSIIPANVINEDGLSSILYEIRLIISEFEQTKDEIVKNLYLNPMLFMNVTYIVGEGSLVVFTKTFDCPSGNVIDESFVACVPCSPGEFSDVVKVHYRSEIRNVYYPVLASKCSTCPKGFYQEDIGSSECKICPDFYTTLTEGAKSVDECKALCLPGTYSSDQVTDCQHCSTGYWQPLYGSKKCLSCAEVPSDDDRCPITINPSEIDRTTLIIATAVASSVLLICFLLVFVVIFAVGLRKTKQKRAKTAGSEKVAPFRSAVKDFEATSVNRAMPVTEPNGNDMRIHNPGYFGEENVLLMQNLENSELHKNLNAQEGKTQVTFIDDVDDKSIGETNMSFDDILIVQGLLEQAMMQQKEVYAVEDKSVGETNKIIEESKSNLEEFEPLTTNDLPEEQIIANGIVKNAISSAMSPIYANVETPLLNAEEDMGQDEDMLQNLKLAELENEIAKQIPQRLSTVSVQSDDQVGLETISEESSSERIIVDAIVEETTTTAIIGREWVPKQQNVENQKNISAPKQGFAGITICKITSEPYVNYSDEEDDYEDDDDDDEDTYKFNAIEDSQTPKQVTEKIESKKLETEEKDKGLNLAEDETII